MVTEKIKSQVSALFQSMDAEEIICAIVIKEPEYVSFLEKEYQKIAKRLGVSIEDVRNAGLSLIY